MNTTFKTIEQNINNLRRDYGEMIFRMSISLRKAIEEGYYSHYNWYIPEGDGFGEWQLNCCQIDSAVADIIIQFSLFGEVLFG